MPSTNERFAVSPHYLAHTPPLAGILPRMRLAALGRCLTLVIVFANLALTAVASAQAPVAGSLAGHPNWPAAKKPSDVDTAEHLLASLYDVISGPAGQARDWDRFRSLFLPDGRLGVVRPDVSATHDAPERKGDIAFLSPDMYVERDDPYFKTHGFFEHSIANRFEEFGNLVEVWSTYESRHSANDAQPFARGVNCIQIVHAQGRFWLASVIWDEERSGVTLPAKYLK
jgi:hypothetical protein